MTELMAKCPSSVALTFLLALGLTLALLWSLGAGPAAVSQASTLDTPLAQAGTGVIRVALTGTNTPGCGSVPTPCATVQYAVDEALAGEEIRIAGGVYAGVQVRFGLTQTVYINKNLTLRGGYTTTDWTTSNPAVYTTTLDAQQGGRVIVSTGAGVNPTIENLRAINGNINGSGGGIYASNNITLTNVQLISNSAATGGGAIYQAGSGATMINNSCIVDNSDYSVHYVAGTTIDATGNWWGLANGPSGYAFGGGDSVSDNVDGSGYLTAPIFGCPTLSPVEVLVSKVVTPATASMGETITFTINFGNTGDRIARHIYLTDVVPISLTSVVSGYTGSDLIEFTGSVPTYTWRLTDTQPGGGGVITLVGQISSALTSDSIFTNTAVISTKSVDTDTGNNTDAAAISVLGVPDLLISKAVTPTSVAQGDAITYTLTFSNVSSKPTTGVVITDIVPVTLTAHSVISSSDVIITDTSTPPTYTWQVADLGVGQGGVITITALYSPTRIVASFTNTVVITADLDSDPSNNSGAALVMPDDDGDGIPNCLDLDSDNDDRLDVAEAGNGALDGNNDGLLDNQNDTDGDGLADVVDPDDGGLLAAPAPDSDGDGLVDFLEANLTDLSLTKTVTPTVVAPGETITYTLTFSNTRPEMTFNVIITDVIPISVTNLSVISSGVAITDTGASPAFVWNVQPLTATQGGIIIISGQVALTATAGTFTNTAEISGAGDITPGNNSASAGVMVIPLTGDLELTKRVYAPDYVIQDNVKISDNLLSCCGFERHPHLCGASRPAARRSECPRDGYHRPRRVDGRGDVQRAAGRPCCLAHRHRPFVHRD